MKKCNVLPVLLAGLLSLVPLPGVADEPWCSGSCTPSDHCSSPCVHDATGYWTTCGEYGVCDPNACVGNWQEVSSQEIGRRASSSCFTIGGVGYCDYDFHTYYSVTEENGCGSTRSRCKDVETDGSCWGDCSGDAYSVCYFHGCWGQSCY